MRNIRRMPTLIRRLLISLLAGGLALVAAYQVILRVALLTVPAADAHDGQAGMGPFFLAVFLAPVVGLLTFSLLFRRSRKWQ